jgi:hypothetical protein
MASSFYKRRPGGHYFKKCSGFESRQDFSFVALNIAVWLFEEIKRLKNLDKKLGDIKRGGCRLYTA